MQNKQITLFYRCPGVNYSIERVFDTILEELNKTISVKKYCVKYYRARPFPMIKNMIYCWINRDDINHITGDIHYCSVLLPSKNTILTIHDMVSIENSTGRSRLLTAISYFLWYYLPVRRVKYITCISDKTRLSLTHYFPWAQNKITVIPNPINPEYKYVYRQFNDNHPVVLHIGTRSNKNLQRVIKALDGIKCHLKIIGKLEDQDIVLLKQTHCDYSNVYNISDREIIRSYIDCDIVSFPSTYEGFGMPIIEAFATGRIVVTSDLSPMKELSEDAAILVNPYDIDNIRRGFLSSIYDSQLRTTKISKGLAIVKKYTVTAIAKQYLDLYKQI